MSGQSESPDRLSRLAGTSVLVTGVNGFLGASTAAAAVRAGAEVIGIDLQETLPRGEKLRASLGGGGIGFRAAELTVPDDWSRVLTEVRPAVILHLAGTISRGRETKDWRRCLEANLLTTTAMVRCLAGLRSAERPRVVCPGSQMEYGLAAPPWTEETPGRPGSPYATSKLLATELLLGAARSGLIEVCVARLPIVYGPGQAPLMFIPELICKAMAGEPFRMTEGRQKRRFLYVGDAAVLLLGLAAGLLDGADLPELLNAPASDPTAIRDVAERVARWIDGPVSLEIGAIPERRDERADAWPDDSRARSLGFANETSLEEGLRATVAWFRAHPWFRERRSS